MIGRVHCNNTYLVREANAACPIAWHAVWRPSVAHTASEEMPSLVEGCHVRGVIHSGP